MLPDKSGGRREPQSHLGQAGEILIVLLTILTTCIYGQFLRYGGGETLILNQVRWTTILFINAST